MWSGFMRWRVSLSANRCPLRRDTRSRTVRNSTGSRPLENTFERVGEPIRGCLRGGRIREMLDHDEAIDVAAQERVEERRVVVERHAAVGLAVRTQHVGMRQDAVAAVHLAAVDRIEPDGANAVEDPLAQFEL